MFNHEIFAVSFGRSLELTRSGAPIEDRKAALGAVFALTSIASAMMRVYQDMLTVDDVGIPDSLPFVPGIIERMRDHGVAEVAIAKGATPFELLALIRGLASDPQTDGGVRRIKMRLRDARSTAIMVIPVQSGAPDDLRTSSVTQAFEAEVGERAVARPSAPTRPPEPAEPPAPRVTPPPELPAIANTVDLGPRASGERRSAGQPEAPPAVPAPAAAAPAAAASNTGQAPAAPPAPPRPAGFRATGVRTSGPSAAEGSGALPNLGLPVGPPKQSLNAALAEVAREPYAAGILDRLTELFLAVQDALERNELEPAVHALAAMIAWEPEAPEGSTRTSYKIVLQRILTREHLELVATCVSDPRLGPEAIKVVQRGGPDAAEMLLARLAAADELKERRALVTALRGIQEGLEKVVHMLEHSQWTVVRNMAEAMGVQRVDEAVPNLVKCLGHGDARVRRAAAIALAKIGTPSTVEPLRRVLKDGDDDLKVLVAASISGISARALAMPLVAFADNEEEPEVLREYYRALGRIGTPDAVRALAKAAEPGGLLLGRRPAATRVAAVEGLRCASGPAATAALENLARDGDRAVREAAAGALAEHKARAASLGT